MSLFPDITPLTNEIKAVSLQLQNFNANQIRTNQLLIEILTEIRSIKDTSIVGDKLRNLKK